MRHQRLASDAEMMSIEILSLKKLSLVPHMPVGADILRNIQMRRCRTRTMSAAPVDSFGVNWKQIRSWMLKPSPQYSNF